MAEKAQAKKLLSVFRSYDQSGDGVIDRFEMAEVLSGLDSKWSGERIAALFDAVDSDDSGKVEMDEFVEWVMGANAAVAEVMAEKPLLVLRLDGFGLRSYAELAAALEPLASIEQLHHVKGNAKESLVLYDSEEDAKKAFEALGGTIDHDQLSQEGLVKVRIKADTPLFQPGEAALDLVQVASLTPQMFSELGQNQACPESMIEELSVFVDKNKLAFGEDYDTWRGKIDALPGSDLTVRAVARLMRLMSLNVQIKSGHEEMTAMWRRTMRLLAKGCLELQDPNKMSDMLAELQGFTGEMARPKSSSRQRAEKKARDLGHDDPWAMISKGRQNSALAAAFGA